MFKEEPRARDLCRTEPLDSARFDFWFYNKHFQLFLFLPCFEFLIFVNLFSDFFSKIVSEYLWEMFREKWDITETNKTEKDHFISTITS